FPLGRHVTSVIMESDEMTAICPVTGQPDLYRCVIGFTANKGIESKSLKLYLRSYREEGAFCEALAETILMDVVKVLEDPIEVRVSMVQKPRGGISITADASYFRGD
ncbi:MAG TPA: hypothetical protein VH593_32165, partial [Ktedonobacteraceae bacterium]